MFESSMKIEATGSSMKSSRRFISNKLSVELEVQVLNDRHKKTTSEEILKQIEKPQQFGLTSLCLPFQFQFAVINF